MIHNQIDTSLLPADDEEMINFRLGEDGSMSKSRKDEQHCDYGTNQARWPICVGSTSHYMAVCRTGEGRPDTMPWLWIV